MSYSAYPSQMRFLLNSLNNFSRNYVKTSVSFPQTAGPNDLVVVEIPAGCIVDMQSLTFHGLLSTSFTASAGVDYLVPSKFSGSFIQYLQVEVNGVVVTQIENWNQLYALYMKYMGGDAERNRMSIFEFGRNFIAAPSADTNLSNVPFFIKPAGLGGFLSCGKYINTSITGPIKITMRMAPVASLIYANGTSPSYSITSMAWSYSVVTCDDGFYNDLIMRQLESQPLQIAFTNYTSVMGALQATNNANNRFSISTQSLDGIWHTCLPSDYTTAGAIQADTESSKYFYHGVTDGSLGNVQLQIGNTLIPQYRYNDASEIFSTTVESLGIGSDTLGSFIDVYKGATAQTGTIGKATYTDKYTKGNFLAYFRLNHGSGTDQSNTTLKSGLNTQGTNAWISVTMNTDSAIASTVSIFPLTFAQYTSVVSVGKYRQIQYTP